MGQKPQKVKVSLEMFGNKRLSAEIDPEDLKGKSLGQVVDLMVHQRKYDEEDALTVSQLQRQMRASGGYIPMVGVRDGPNYPVVFEPTILEAPAQNYIMPSPTVGDELRVSLQGSHTVAYAPR